MNTNRPFTMIASLIFLAMAIVHAYRLVTHFQMIVGSHAMPMIVSWIAIVVTLVLAWGLHREARR